MELVARCDTVDAVMAAAEHGADVVIFGGESYHHRPFLKEDWQAAVKAAHDHGAAVWAGTPRIVREAHRAAVQGDLERARALRDEADGRTRLLRKERQAKKLTAARERTDDAPAATNAGTGA